MFVYLLLLQPIVELWVDFFKIAKELDLLPDREHTTQPKLDLTMKKIQPEHKSGRNKIVRCYIFSLKSFRHNLEIIAKIWNTSFLQGT